MKAMELAIILTAYDRATRVINDTVNAMETRMRKFNADMSKGLIMWSSGQAGLNMLKGPINAMEHFEDAAASLRSSMMLSGGILDVKQWEKVEKLAMKLGGDLPGTNEDMIKMMDVMKRNGVSMQDILAGTAEAAANLGFVNKESYERTAEVFSHIHNAIGIAGKDMPAFADLLNRAVRTGASLTDLEYAFGRSGNQLRYLGLTGVEANKSMMALYATFIRGGATGQTVGTNFARIMGEVLNPKHYAEMQVAAKKYLGTTLDLVDRSGNFRGIENMVAQFDKLRGLSHIQIAEILAPLTGGQGLDDTILKILSKGGKDEFNKTIVSMFENTATLERMAKEQLNTPGAKWEQAMGEFHNMLIEIGKTWKPILMPLYDMLKKVFQIMQDFVQNHPILTRIIGIFIAMVSAAMMLSGAFRILRALMFFSTFGGGIWGAFGVLNKVMFATRLFIVTQLVPAIASIGRALLALAANPVVLIAGALILAAILIIKNWDKLKSFFSELLNWFREVGTKFYEAGRNLVMNIWSGISAAARYPIDAMKNLVKTIRDYLPFSPAKLGPLRDIHRIQLVETIAKNIKPNAIQRAMHRVGQSTMDGLGSYATSGGAGSVSINYAPVIHMGIGSDKSDFLDILETHKREVARIVEETVQRNKRLGYS